MLLAVSAAVVGLVATGVLFAGSAERIPAGVSVGGVSLSGLTPDEAEAKLARRAAELASVPVVFTAAGKRWKLAPGDVDLRVDWAAVVAKAREAGDAPLPLRGLKRVKLRLLGVEVDPLADVYDAALAFELDRFAGEVDVPAREAAIVLDGLRPRIAPSRAGRELDREAARKTVIAALAGFERKPVALPVRVDEPEVPTSSLAAVLAQARTALSAPVRLGYGDTHWRLSPKQVARFLLLPANGARELEIGGPRAERYLTKLAGAFDRPPKNADLAITGSGEVEVVPAIAGRKLDVSATASALLAAALSPTKREAELAVTTVQPKVTTAKVRSYGITRVLSSYSTPYAGTSDRITNLQLAVRLLDRTLVAPGATFSFNDTVGPRTEERGFRTAPVIVGGEYEEGVGGGVSQVATTVFNAAWEAGLKIAERNPHALYISRYQLGRDATVNYPDLDLKFVNDTERWLMLRGSYDDAGIAVTILGAPSGRRVVSLPGPLEEIAPPKVERLLDPMLFKGQRVVEDFGEPARSVSVVRTVYRGDEVLYQENWTTTYRSEPKVVRVGTKPRPSRRRRRRRTRGRPRRRSRASLARRRRRLSRRRRRRDSLGGLDRRA